MEENNIDRYFKEGLDEHVVVPSGDVWDRIDAQLSSEKDTNGGAVQWRTMALMSLALLLLVSGLFYWRMQRLDQENSALELALIEQQRTTEASNSSPTQVGLEQVTSAAKNSIEQELDQGRRNESSIRDIVEVRSDEVPMADGRDNRTINDLEEVYPLSDQLDNVAQKESPGAGISQDQVIPKGDSALGGISPSMETESRPSFGIVPGDTDQGEHTADGNPSSVSHKGKESDKKDLNWGISPHVYIPIDIAPLPSDAVARAIDTNRPGCGNVMTLTESKWMLGIGAYQNKTFRRIRTESLEEDQVRKDLDRSEQASSSYGVQGYVGYRLGKRMSLTLGLDYSQWRQSGNYQIRYTPPVPSDASLEPLLFTVESELITSTSTEEVIIEALFDPTIETWVGASNQNSVQVAREELVTFLSIPVNLRYQTYLRRMGLQGGLGLAYDHILSSSRETQITGDFEDSNVSGSAIQKDGFISAQASAALFYRFSERNKIYLGPRFKSWLVPLYENEGLRTYPYSNAFEIGLEIGL